MDKETLILTARLFVLEQIVLTQQEFLYKLLESQDKQLVGKLKDEINYRLQHIEVAAELYFQKLGDTLPELISLLKKEAAWFDF